MALTHSTAGELGEAAPEFNLPGVDGQNHSLSEFSRSSALVVIFMCNHCPYVIATQDRINSLAKEFAPKGVSVVGINSNDAERYPADNFAAMKVRAREQGFVFPYLYDESQAVARAYGAVCTPDFYIYGNEAGKFLLRYRGRLDDNWKDESSVKRRDLADALSLVIAGQAPSLEQKPSIGCSIKWK